MEDLFRIMDFGVEQDSAPSNDRLLCARIRSFEIDKITVRFKGSLIRTHETDDQKAERPKWKQVFNEINGIISCFSFADLDKLMFEKLLKFFPIFGDPLTVFAKISKVATFQLHPSSSFAKNSTR
jgi:hypothetical protein